MRFHECDTHSPLLHILCALHVVHRTSQRHQETPRYADLVKGNALEFLEPGVLFSSTEAGAWGFGFGVGETERPSNWLRMPPCPRLACDLPTTPERASIPPEDATEGGADDAKPLEDDVPAIKHDGHVEVGGSSRRVGGGRKESPSLLFGGFTCVALTQCPA